MGFASSLAIGAMQSQRGYWLPAGFLLAVWLVITPLKTEAGRVACDAVISEVHRETRTIKQPNVDISKVARKLGTTIAWTEHCMRVYGRRPKRPGLESAESREAELESFEDEEPEETMAEDTEEEGAPDLEGSSRTATAVEDPSAPNSERGDGKRRRLQRRLRHQVARAAQRLVISKKRSPMPLLVLIRHGESQWNLENRFTGWTDVPLTDKGREEARRAGEKLRGIHFDKAYTSVLKRAIDTLDIVLHTIGQVGIPVELRSGPQRAALRRSAGPQQGRDRGEVRQRAGPSVAAQLRCRAAGRRELEGHGGADVALL